MQVLFAEKIALVKAIVIPDAASLCAKAMPSWIAANLSAEQGRGRNKAPSKQAPADAKQYAAPVKRARQTKTVRVPAART